MPEQIPANLYEPLQPRLAFAGSGMTVSWSTFVQLDNPQVRCKPSLAPLRIPSRVISAQLPHFTDGLRPDAMNTIVNSTMPSSTYPTSRTWDNHVKLMGLDYATKYYYKVSYSDCSYCAYVPTYSFTTARAAGDMTPFSMAGEGFFSFFGFLVGAFEARRL